MLERIIYGLAGFTLLGGPPVGPQYGAGQDPPADRAFPWPEGKRLAISLTFDDARPSQLEHGLPILNRHGVRATFYVHPGPVEERLNDWKEAARAGHELGNHSESHPCSGNFLWSRDNALEQHSLSSISRDIESANTALARLIGTEPTTFAYPCGQKFVGRGTQVESYVPVIAERFRAGRGWLDEAPNDPAYCDLAQLYGMELDGLTFDQVRVVIEAAAEQGGWLVFCGHDIAPQPARQTVRTDTLEELCRFASDPSSGIWIDTVDRIAAYVQQKRSEGFSAVP